MPTSTLSSDRQIRVFISSTFRDMQEERDILIKKIFPQLRKLCEERAVTWTEVDLRWGITDEQKAEGKVLPLCLEEIKRCRPYFIGILGERYGWVPEPTSISTDLLESQPWLKQHLDRSVTELEILHGVFSEGPMHEHAYFYFRDPKYLESIPSEKRHDFTTESAEAEAKLAKLKQKIRGARDELVCELRESYTTLEQLSEWILEDFTKLIDRLYPKDKTPDELDQEAARHEAYARSRRLAFVGRDDLLRRMDEEASTKGNPAVLTGESGCGKSALLAEWVARWRKNHPHDLIVQHYIGSTPDSADWQGLVRRILSELKRAFPITEEIPVQPDALRSALFDWIVKAAGSRPVVLVLDALNQLTEDGAAQQLGWLPSAFPSNFRVFVSSLPSESLDALRKRGWPELMVSTFARDDIADATIAYFRIFSKTPPTEIVAQMEATPAACNALYLRAVLDELRQFGKREELHAKVAEYLSAADLPELFHLILTRWEKDFGVELVRDSLSLVWAARRGLSQTELADLLGENAEPLPRAKWTPFYLAAEASLTQCAGSLGFFHAHLKQAVHRKYLPTKEDEILAHRKIAFYFLEMSLLRKVDQITGRESLSVVESERSRTRLIEEMPWQLAKSEEWEILASALVNLSFFGAVEAYSNNDVRAYWSQIQKYSSIRMVESYNFVLDDPQSHLDHREQLMRLGQLLMEYGHFAEALKLWRFLGEYYRQVGDAVRVQACVACESVIFGFQGDLDGALKSQEAAERFFRGQMRWDAVAAMLLGQARTWFKKGDLEIAMKFCDESERLCRELGDKSNLASVLGIKGNILHRRGDYAGALKIYREEQTVYREESDLRKLAGSLGDQALLERSIGNSDDAMRLHKEEEQIYRELGSRPGIQLSLGHQGIILLANGDDEAALKFLQEQERMCRELGMLYDLQRSLGNQAVIFARRGEYQEALRRHKEEEQLCRRTGAKDELRKCLANQALILMRQFED